MSNEGRNWFNLLSNRKSETVEPRYFLKICLFLGSILAVGEIEPRASAYAKHMLYQRSRTQVLSLGAALSVGSPGNMPLGKPGPLGMCCWVKLWCTLWCTGLQWGERGPQHCIWVPAGCSTLDPCNLSIPTQKDWSTHWLNIYHQMSNFKTPLGPRIIRGEMHFKRSECRKSKFLSASKQTVSPVRLSRSLPASRSTWETHGSFIWKCVTCFDAAISSRMSLILLLSRGWHQRRLSA